MTTTTMESTTLALIAVLVCSLTICHALTSPLTSTPSLVVREKSLQASSFFRLQAETAGTVGATTPTPAASRFCKARELVKSLVEEDKCFSTEEGAICFGDVCASNVVYEDCYEPQPFVGRTVRTCR
jgi:hypothetical protein